MNPAPTSCTTWVVIEASGPVLTLEKFTVRGMGGDSEIHRGGWSLALALVPQPSMPRGPGMVQSWDWRGWTPVLGF